ncbi:sigma-70 family RNA polymerase sigma factor [Cytophagaceae bacterium DM2B3-1]|uniref:RNA polymerase sigma factor n=1 Tax=Xanthocytophaga flava TaxID=3048013 RepID=A0AAE3QSP8_9BACT|nr:sigma-70 family RNA polymerase sigma factor [Xanthocytophaga flavus]MDJ1473209.1 sigma-70 family RNA polymerase sigma factor [Xanthocytophaga flavus]MDJ1484236.1 sigma-70 family RNA polymerase sigma factor [Xanthocytophaga flavus]MDJ1495399.1 sigma-70 family RNA polymerase sigma factor [Xanthocytophaga flavus]
MNYHPICFSKYIQYFHPSRNKEALSRSVTIAENELIVMLKQHDRKGFEYLYDKYSGALYGVVLRIVKSEEIAEDVVQEAFVKIWRNVSSYEKTKGTLFTWILNIARNTAIDKVRSQDFKQNSKIQDVDQNVSMVDKQANVNQEIDHIGLEKYVLQLKPEHRLIIEYLYFKGYTQSEVATELNMPLGTVKTRVKMAISHLRELIDEKIDFP